MLNVLFKRDGLSLIETMVGIAIGGIVLAAVMASMAEISVVNGRHQVEQLVNQSYYQGMQTALNSALFTDQNSRSANPLAISPDLKNCLANNPRDLGGGGYFDCRSLDSTAGKGTAVPAAVSPDLNVALGLNGKCGNNGAPCLVQRTTVYDWVCPDANFCSGLRLRVKATPIASAGGGERGISSISAVAMKERSGTVFIPARQLTSKGEIKFQCGTGANPNYSLSRIDYVKLTDRGGCADFDPGAACRNPMNLYGANRNCVERQDKNCPDGFTRSGLFNDQAGCIAAANLPSAPAPTPLTGTCGPANGAASATAPTGNLCSSGTPSAVASGTQWSWTCAGQSGGADAACGAPKPAPQLWTWRGSLGQTTCNAMGICDGTEWASCTGPACALARIQCYTAVPRGAVRYPVNSTQTTQPTGLCFPF